MIDFEVETYVDPFTTATGTYMDENRYQSNLSGSMSLYGLSL